MRNEVFDNMLSRYELTTEQQKRNAIFEVNQQIILAGLYAGGFFESAAFYGGTCLRIFHGLQRFSEDMDFSLLAPDENFDFSKYFQPIVDAFALVGREVEITKKDKKSFGKVESAFLKDNTDVYDVTFQTEKSIKIKIEVDTNPPLNFTTEQKLLLQPHSFMTRCFTLPDLFAGKMHALVYRACCVSDDKGAYLAKLIEERKDTLDALFQATPNEVMRMDKLNDQLKAITRQMHERVAIVNEDAAKIFVDGNFEVEGRLNYNPNAAGAIIQLENDDYFGSDFAKIHKVIDMLFDQGYLPIKCADYIRASDLVNDFDNGNWETAYEDWQPQVDKFKHINICFAIHSLNAYHPYSIPDILRMNNFDVTVTIKKIMTMYPVD